MRVRYPAVLLLVALLSVPAAAHSPTHHHGLAAREAARLARAPDFSRKKQRGKASYYAHTLAGRKMADGTRLDLASDAAASKTLPLGTKARVKNLKNGKSAVVQIRDRGPYAKGRIIDLTPRIAKQLGLRSDGLALVEVEPIRFPPSD